MKGIMIIILMITVMTVMCLTAVSQEDIGGNTWESSKLMINASSGFTDNPPVYILIVNGTSGIDSTQYYRIKPDNFVMPEIVDSDTVTTHVQVMVRAGFLCNEVTGEYVMANVDSFTISSTDQNDNPPHRLKLPKAEYFYLVARGYWGNGSNRELRFNLDRSE